MQLTKRTKTTIVEEFQKNDKARAISTQVSEEEYVVTFNDLVIGKFWGDDAQNIADELCTACNSYIQFSVYFTEMESTIARLQTQYRDYAKAGDELRSDMAYAMYNAHREEYDAMGDYIKHMQRLNEVSLKGAHGMDPEHVMFLNAYMKDGVEALAKVTTLRRAGNSYHRHDLMKHL